MRELVTVLLLLAGIAIAQVENPDITKIERLQNRAQLLLDHSKYRFDAPGTGRRPEYVELKEAFQALHEALSDLDEADDLLIKAYRSNLSTVFADQIQCSTSLSYGPSGQSKATIDAAKEAGLILDGPVRGEIPRGALVQMSIALTRTPGADAIKAMLVKEGIPAPKNVGIGMFMFLDAKSESCAKSLQEMCRRIGRAMRSKSSMHIGAARAEFVTGKPWKVKLPLPIDGLAAGQYEVKTVFMPVDTEGGRKKAVGLSKIAWATFKTPFTLSHGTLKGLLLAGPSVAGTDDYRVHVIAPDWIKPPWTGSILTKDLKMSNNTQESKKRSAITFRVTPVDATQRVFPVDATIRDALGRSTTTRARLFLSPTSVQETRVKLYSSGSQAPVGKALEEAGGQIWRIARELAAPGNPKLGRLAQGNLLTMKTELFITRYKKQDVHWEVSITPNGGGNVVYSKSGTDVLKNGSLPPLVMQSATWPLGGYQVVLRTWLDRSSKCVSRHRFHVVKPELKIQADVPKSIYQAQRLGFKVTLPEWVVPPIRASIYTHGNVKVASGNLIKFPPRDATGRLTAEVGLEGRFLPGKPVAEDVVWISVRDGAGHSARLEREISLLQKGKMELSLNIPSTIKSGQRVPFSVRTPKGSQLNDFDIRSHASVQFVSFDRRTGRGMLVGSTELGTIATTSIYVLANGGGQFAWCRKQIKISNYRKVVPRPVVSKPRPKPKTNEVNPFNIFAQAFSQQMRIHQQQKRARTQFWKEKPEAKKSSWSTTTHKPKQQKKAEPRYAKTTIYTGTSYHQWRTTVSFTTLPFKTKAFWRPLNAGGRQVYCNWQDTPSFNRNMAFLAKGRCSWTHRPGSKVRID